jgi:hypothetical protein
MSATWENNPQYLAQVGHFFGALSVILTATLFFGVLGSGWAPILVTLGVGIVAAAFKEFYLDLRPPENDSLADSAMDFGFYMLGGAVGMGFAALAMHLMKVHCS